MSSFATSSLRPLLRAAPNTALSARSFSSSSSRSVARMIITGRLGAEPELRATASGAEVVKYTVSSEKGPSNNRQTSWFRVTGFVPAGPQRDYLLGLQKGTLLCVEAEASYRKWQDEEGREQRTLDIIQRHIEVLKRPRIKGETTEETTEEMPSA